ncbi:MAG: NAD(P)/FAD-dependent oxidoreductase [Actinobacteria bacterium]|nr:NAD(P)/FAD-dependent oxidoreductase [Actinomycetota bacterium]MCA1720692.1 NAD(P)/FAD-dependent oxidoreductase [Actinomycetota bacterium]
MSAPQEVDAVVVGGGPAGLAAALWLGRYRRSVVVVDSQEYRSGMVDRSHGYLGRDPQTPTELLERGREELLAYPTASVVHGSVTSVTASGPLFSVESSNGSWLAHRVVLANGVRDVVPEVRGFDEHYGASVVHCPACDGYEARDRDVVAIGWDVHLVGFATTLLNWARSVTVVTDGHRFEGDETCRSAMGDNGIELVEEDVVEFVGPRGGLECVKLRSGRSLPTSLVFFSLAHVPQVGLAESLGCDLDDEGYVVVDPEGQTTVPGVYAAGDLTPGLQLVQVAAASGAVAGVGAAQSFFGSETAPTSPDPAPDPTVPGQGG